MSLLYFSKFYVTDSAPTVKFNATLLSINKSNVLFEEDIYVPSSICDTEQCGTKSDFNLTNYDDRNNTENMKNAARLISLSIDKNFNALLVNKENENSKYDA